MTQNSSTEAAIFAAKRLWRLCGDQSFAWSDLDEVERDHWIGIAQKVVAEYQKYQRVLGRSA